MSYCPGLVSKFSAAQSCSYLQLFLLEPQSTSDHSDHTQVRRDAQMVDSGFPANPREIHRLDSATQHWRLWLLRLKSSSQDITHVFLPWPKYGWLSLIGGWSPHQSIFIGIHHDLYLYTHYPYSFIGCVTTTCIPCFHPSTHVHWVPINILQFITRKNENRIVKLKVFIWWKKMWLLDVIIQTSIQTL